MEILILFLAASATALATGLGAIPVFFLGDHAATLRPLLVGIAAGVMTVASVFGLILPGLGEGEATGVVIGLGAGAAGLLVARRHIEHTDPSIAGIRGAGVRASFLTFLVLTVHSLPEGLAIGTAYASETDGLSLFILIAIAAQNVPEGTSVAIPMAAAGFTRRAQFWAAVATSAPQPVGAIVAFLVVEEVSAVLPYSFGLAAGAMLALVVVELLPSALGTGHRRLGTLGAVGGAAVMLALALALAV